MAELIYALWRRDVVKLLRDRQSFAASLARPFLWLVALGFGLRASFRMETEGVDYISFLVPGIAAMSVLFTSMFSAISIVWDREFGFLKELLVAPVPRHALVLGKMVAGASTSTLEAAIVLALSPLLGARIAPLGALAALGVLLVFGLAVTALGVAIAARMRSFEGFGGIVNFLIQPIFFLSGALYPLSGLPRALEAVVLANPMTYAVDAVRGLTLGVHRFPYALDLGVVAASAVLAGWVATRQFSRMQA